MGDREPVHFNIFKSYNNPSKTTFLELQYNLKEKSVD